MRAGAKQLAKLPRQHIPIKSGNCFERFGTYSFATMANQKITRFQYCRPRNLGDLLARHSSLTQERRSNPFDRIIYGKFVQFMINIRKNICQRTQEFLIGNNRIWRKG